MKDQKHTPPNVNPLSQNEDMASQDANKEPSVLDKLKTQIKKIREIKEKGTGNNDQSE